MTALTAPPAAAGASRQRLQLVVAAALVAGAAVTVALAVRLVAGDVVPARVVVVGGAVLLVAGGLAGGSVRARRLSGRLVGAGAEVAAAAAVVLLGLLVLVLALGRLPDEREEPLVLPALVAVGAGVLAHPRLRGTAASLARRGAAGRVRGPLDVLDTFGDRTTRAVPLEELLLQLAESLRRTLSLTTLEIWTGSGTALQRLLSVPHRSAPTTTLGPAEVDVLRRAGLAGEGWLQLWLPQLLVGRAGSQVRVAPAGYGGELLGLVVAERAEDADRFGAADERLLGDVVRRLGVALHNRQLDAALQATLDDLQQTNEELRASRARLVAGSDAERRRIERDIHDGAQQHLVALAVNLGLGRGLLREDPDAAAEILDAMAVDLRETIAQVRDLAHGVYPPLLRESGLPAALRAAATRSPLSVGVEATGLARYGPEVEAAVYFCCLEALQNSAKHAPGSSVQVRLWQDGTTLRFTVADDGPGFAPATTASGQGLQNMTDRLGAVGGAISWTSAPGEGVRLQGEVPSVATLPAA